VNLDQDLLCQSTEDAKINLQNRKEGELRQYYDRKVAEGKNKMSVINALRAKLIALIFAVINQDREYK
jgi:pullulanase/glycogen debranching enzyme